MNGPGGAGQHRRISSQTETIMPTIKKSMTANKLPANPVEKPSRNRKGAVPLAIQSQPIPMPAPLKSTVLPTPDVAAPHQPATSLRAPTQPQVPLCPYQERWLADQSRFKIAVKARRIGFTFATTLEIALDLIARRTRWLIISRTQDTAKEALKEIKNHFAAIRVATAAAAGISERPTELFLDGIRVHQYVIELPNGSEVTAMTAHPDAARGFGGNVFLDEHAFHRDSHELWKGAAASVLRGHRLIVVSTPHYQTGNYYRLARQADLVSGHEPGYREQVIGNRKQEPGYREQVIGNRKQEEGYREQVIGNSNQATPSPSSPPPIPYHLSPTTCLSPPPTIPYNLSPITCLWSAHWVDVHIAAPQLAKIGVPIDLNELRELAGDDETWNQEFCCQFLSAAEMWIPLELIAAARSPQATVEWNPSQSEPRPSGSGPQSVPQPSHTPLLYIGADIGRKHDRTAIWIDERIADISICRGLILLDRTPFEQQFHILSDLLANNNVRRACIDQTGIGMALVERLQNKFGLKVEGVTFTGPLKEEMSIRVRRRMEERLDKIPDNAPEIERDLAAVKRQITTSGNLRFDADRTDAGHADIYWAKALADMAADSSLPAVSLSSDDTRLGQVSRPVPIPEENHPTHPQSNPNRPSIWDSDRELPKQGIFA